MPKLSYRIDASAPERRELEVRLRYSPAGPDTDPVEFFLPTWTPGSYLIREYSRHLSRVEAVAIDGAGPLRCEKVAKNRVRVERGTATGVELRYRVYAHELTVRTADVNADHAFWNHACTLLWPVGHEHAEAEIEIVHPAGWSVACSLPASAANGREHSPTGTTLRARDLEEAVDSPVLVGRFDRREWSVDGVPHAIVLDGLAGLAPPPTLVDDLTRIVREAAAVFGGGLPYERYVFLTLLSDEGHGGLEHRDGSVLLAARTALCDERQYRDLLALAAHELFHAWNVKRMRPVEFWRYDYEQENYTRLLWLMEGWTAYYDDLLVARAGLSSESDYLAAMAKNVQALLASPGRLALSLEDSSFDAWIRLYRPDENTRNSSQNYYGNGAVAAMCLDLSLRRATDGQRSLDDVLQALYAATFGEHRGYCAEDVERIVAAIGGEQCAQQLRSWVREPFDPDLGSLLQTVGLSIVRSEADKPYLGVTFQAGSTVVSSVTRQSPAWLAGIAPGDELLGLAGLRVTGSSWQRVLSATARIGEPIDVLLSRRGTITTVRATPSEGLGTIKLVPSEGSTEQQVARRLAWLGSRSTTPTN